MTMDENNPFPSSGVTRPGFETGTLVELPSQGGVVERLKELVRSVAAHTIEKEKDELGFEIMKSKPEFIMIRGTFGSGKSMVLNTLYIDCKQGRIKTKIPNRTVRKVVSIAIYQPLHALLSKPENLLDVLQQRLIREAPNKEIREAIEKAKDKAEQTVVEKDPLLKRIYVWRYSVDAAIRSGTDTIVVILDELEESLEDYTKFAKDYAAIFGILREFTDRQIGPVITVLGVTPRAIDTLVEETKHALLRRAVTIELPRLTSAEELLTLFKAFDSKIEKYVDSSVIDLIYRLAQGNPGWALASIHWAWEEMRYRGFNRIDAQLAQEAIESIVWKGKKLASELRQTSITFENDPVSVAAQRALETERKKFATELSPEIILKGIMYAIESISKEIEQSKDCDKIEEEFEQRGTHFKAVSSLALEFYSEPNIEYSTLLLYGDDEEADESNIADILDVSSQLHRDFVIFVMPPSATKLRRTIDKVCAGKIYRGLEWRELIIPILLGKEDMKELAILTQMVGSSASIKHATEKLVAKKYGITAKIEDLMRKLRESGKSIPNRWNLISLKNHVQWGIYTLLAKRFTDIEFTDQEAVSFVLSHYDLVEETKEYYNSLRQSDKYFDLETFKKKINRDVVSVLKVLVGSGFTIYREGTKKYYVPPLLNHEKELYELIKRIRETEKGRNPGAEDLKYEFFGKAGKTNNIFGLARGMEGKGYIIVIQEGPLQRRFYRELDPITRLTETEIALKKLDKEIKQIVSKRLRENKITLAKSKLEKFVKPIIDKTKPVLREAHHLLDKASANEREDFERLRLINRAKILALTEMDKTEEIVGKWLSINKEIVEAQADIQRFSKIVEHYEAEKRLSREKVIEIKGHIVKVEDLLESTVQAAATFEFKDSRAKLRNLKTMIKQAEHKIADELQEVGEAEKNIIIAEERVKEIANLLTRTKPHSEILELDKKITEFSAKISEAKKALEKGEITLVNVEPLPIFLRQATSNKIFHIETQIEALTKAEPLLYSMGQFPDADRIAEAIPRINKILERVKKTSQRDYDVFVKNLGKAYEETEKQRKIFSDKLHTLWEGAKKGALPNFKSLGVDKAISQETSLSEADVRKLRHLLEDQGLVTCRDVT